MSKTKHTKISIPALGALGLQAPAVAAVTKASGVEVPADIADRVHALAADVVRIREARITAPNTRELAAKLADGGTITKDEVIAADVSETWTKIKTSAYTTALARLDDACRNEAAPAIVDALQVQVIDPAIETLVPASALRGETPGTLYDQGRDDDAALMREATEAHKQVLAAVEIAVKLGVRNVTAKDVRKLDDCLEWVHDHGSVDLLATAAAGDDPDDDPASAAAFGRPQAFTVNDVESWSNSRGNS